MGQWGAEATSAQSSSRDFASQGIVFIFSSPENSTTAAAVGCVSTNLRKSNWESSCRCLDVVQGEVELALTSSCNSFPTMSIATVKARILSEQRPLQNAASPLRLKAVAYSSNVQAKCKYHNDQCGLPV